MQSITGDREEPMLEADDEAYYDETNCRDEHCFDTRLLESPVSALLCRVPIVLSEEDSVATAVGLMEREHRSCVLISEDGSRRSRLQGIFTERDILLRVVDCGRDSGEISLREVMVKDPEALPRTAPIAWVLNLMSVGGFRHVPVVDDRGCPAFVVSVRDAVEFLVESFPSEILNLPPEYGVERYKTRDGA